MSLINNIENEIEDGRVFSIYDFISLGSYEAVKKSLQRLEENKKISRIVDGIYYKPKKSLLLNVDVPAQMDEIALCIARRFKWSIVPSGELCLNMLHISTQIPSGYIFMSDGPYRNYEINGKTLSFRHTTNREIKNLSYKSGLIIQAIKALGKEYITNVEINKMKEFLSHDEKVKLLNETLYVSTWVRDIVKEIAK